MKSGMKANPLKKIDPGVLRAMDERAGPWLRVDVAYAKEDNLLFEERIYRRDARLWLHEELAAVIEMAAHKIFDAHGWRMVVYDGLRTIEAQARMLRTQRVMDNPQWLQEPRLLSPPGAGGHPRGMAVDVGLEDAAGQLVDMGTPFDFLAPSPEPAHNPAHRDYPDLEPRAAHNRDILTGAILEAAHEAGIRIIPLPQEWWDFRLPKEIYESYAPLSDADLPPEMRMCEPDGPA